MPRRKKNKELNIKSQEVQFVFKLLLVVVGVTFVIAPFVNALITNQIIKLFGFSSVLYGVTMLIYAYGKIFKKSVKRQTLGMLIISFAIMVLISNFVDPYAKEPDPIMIAQTGGQIGFFICSWMIDVFSRIIEVLLSFIILIFGFIIFTNKDPEEIVENMDFVEKIPNVKAPSLPKFPLFGRKRQEVTDVAFGNEDDKLGFSDNDIEFANDVSAKEINNVGGGEAADPLKDANIKEQSTQEEDDDPSFIGEIVEGEDISEEGQKDSVEDEPKYPNWKFPPIDLLQDPVHKQQDPNLHKKKALVIEKTLKSFNIHSKVVDISVGPTVVQYALNITVGTKVSKIKNLQNDLALALAVPASTVRIEAPIPGTSLIGIEIPNVTPNYVFVKEGVEVLLQNKSDYILPLILGRNVAKDVVITDLVKLPHLLVAGATGAGKSAGINSMLLGLLMTKSPDELKLILVDPKMVEMSPYNGIPHLLTPVITDMQLVVNALQWTIEEMLRRYRILKQIGLRNIAQYNAKMGLTAMPYIVIVIDEMADLMLSTGVDVESKIVRLAQMSRAVGIHLILATQRPSVDVITGLIKANVPGRIGFSVATSIDSRVIIDQVGAETLIGKGDMLFKSPAIPRPVRIQGAYTDIADIDRVIEFIKDQAQEVEYNDDVVKAPVEEDSGKSGKLSGKFAQFSEDELFEEALNIVITHKKASSSFLQRRLRIGYNRAARLIEDLEACGAISSAEGAGNRKILISNPAQLLNSVQEDESGE